MGKIVQGRPGRTEDSLKDVDFRLQVLLSGYKRIRDEIFHHKTTLQTVINFIVILVAAELALFSQIVSTEVSAEYTSVLLLLPIAFALLAIYHSAYTMRIDNLASYLDGQLRTRIEELTEPGILRKKSYHATRNILDLPRAPLDARMTYLAKWLANALVSG